MKARTDLGLNSHGPREKTVPELVAVSQIETELDGIDRHVGESGALQQRREQRVVCEREEVRSCGRWDAACIASVLGVII